jgi:hypothetical protein
MPLSGCTRLSSNARFSRASASSLADDDESAGQDLDVIGVAPDPRSTTSDIGVVMPRVGELAATGKDHLRGLGGELPAGIGGAGLDDDRPALDRPGDVQRAAH